MIHIVRCVFIAPVERERVKQSEELPGESRQCFLDPATCMRGMCFKKQMENCGSERSVSQKEGEIESKEKRLKQGDHHVSLLTVCSFYLNLFVFEVFGP